MLKEEVGEEQIGEVKHYDPGKKGKRQTQASVFVDDGNEVRCGNVKRDTS